MLEITLHLSYITFMVRKFCNCTFNVFLNICTFRCSKFFLCFNPLFNFLRMQLMILCKTDGKCEVSDDGIMKRLNESYGLDLTGNPGLLASEMMGLRV